VRTVPLLKTREEVPKALILPIPRYCHPDLKCCTDPGHITNAGPELVGVIKNGLAAVKKTVKSTLFREKVANVRVVDPYTAITNLGPDQYTDPVHLVQDAYGSLAKCVVGLLAGVSEGDNTTDPPSDNKRIRTLSMGAGRGTATRGRGGGSRGWAGRGWRAGSVRGLAGKRRGSF
jgi:hypothetical protein